MITSRQELLYSVVLLLSTPSNTKRYKSGKIARSVITDTHRGVVVTPYGVEGQCVPKGPQLPPFNFHFLATNYQLSAPTTYDYTKRELILFSTSHFSAFLELSHPLHTKSKNQTTRLARLWAITVAHNTHI